MWHELVNTALGNRLRLAITVPPRHLKSVTAAVALVAYLLGKDPTLKITVATYSQDLARQHAEQCRRVMESDWYKATFATRLRPGTNRQFEFATTKGGGRKAVSVGGSVTGFGADIIIVDDCMKPEDAGSQAARDALIQWFDGTLMTRLNNKATGRVISIQQRLREDDLPAYLLEKGYHHLNLPAIAEQEEHIPLGHGMFHHRRPGDLLDPRREDQATLDRIRRDIGPVNFSAQYQQNPVVPEGNLVRLEWFGRYDVCPSRSQFRSVVQSWDTASSIESTADWSVCLTWGWSQGNWYLIDVFRQRLEYPDLKKAVLRLAKVHQPDEVLIERAASGLALLQELRSERKLNAIALKACTDKQERLIACTAQLEEGRFLLPREALWLDAFLSEMRAFPNGRHDDQVDAMSHFVIFQTRKRQALEAERHPVTGRILRNAARPRSRRGAIRGMG